MMSWWKRHMQIGRTGNDAGVDDTDIDISDIDALAGTSFAADVDPHYADLPCYVPLDVDDDGSPFSDVDGVAPYDEMPARTDGRAHTSRARRSRIT